MSKMLVRFMRLDEVKKEKSYIEFLLKGYRQHNVRGVYDGKIKEYQNRVDECNKRIKELEKND